jgi:hypothetical protein
MKCKGWTRQNEKIRSTTPENSKQFQMTKICKITKRGFFAFGVLDFLQRRLFFSEFVSDFGVRILDLLADC